MRPNEGESLVQNISELRVALLIVVVELDYVLQLV